MPSRLSLLSFKIFATSLIVVQFILTAGELTEKEHRTQGALVSKNDLSCYQCDTMVEGDKCTNLANKSTLVKKCQGDKRVCIVKQYSYTTSTENSTSGVKLWSLRRNCTSRCEAGCIVIGERTKLYACTTCCTTNNCNNGKGSATRHTSSCSPMSWTIIMLAWLSPNRLLLSAITYQ